MTCFSSVSNFEGWPAKRIRHAVIQVSSSRWLPVKKGGVSPVRLTLPGSCLSDSQFGLGGCEVRFRLFEFGFRLLEVVIRPVHLVFDLYHSPPKLFELIGTLFNRG